MVRQGRAQGGAGTLIAIAAAACVVLIAALTGALLIHQRDLPSAPARQSRSNSIDVTCANVPCQLLASDYVGDVTAQLYADVRGTDGHVRFAGAKSSAVFDTDISEAGAVLTGDSLSCVSNTSASGVVSACLVSGTDSGSDSGKLGDVFVLRGGYWHPDARPLTATAGSMTLARPADGGDPVVVSVQNDCGRATEADREERCADPDLIVQVFALDGTPIGCTLTATSVTLLPGKGTDVPPSYDLHTCPEL